jgi:single-strand DNA-binding protein
MSSRSLNKVTLIGNLTRDPELRYTPAGTAVCTFGLATNRTWTTQSGETKEETEFHRVVAWNKLGELCSQLLVKGRKVYVEGRLATHSWTAQDGTQRSTTEVVIEDMILLDSKRPVTAETDAGVPPVSSRQEASETVVSSSVQAEETVSDQSLADTEEKKQKKQIKKEKVENQGASKNEDITPDDIPF